jgi:hypothetical protein
MAPKDGPEAGLLRGAGERREARPGEQFGPAAPLPERMFDGELHSSLPAPRPAAGADRP